MGRKTITVSENVYERLEELKDDESWSELLERLAESPDCGGELGSELGDVLTVDHIEDIANITARKAGEEVENRLRGP